MFIWAWKVIRFLLGLGVKDLVEKEVEVSVDALEKKLHDPKSSPKKKKRKKKSK